MSEELIDEIRERWTSDEAVEGMTELFRIEEKLREFYENKLDAITGMSTKIVEFMKVKRLLDESDLDAEPAVESSFISFSPVRFRVYVDEPEQIAEVARLFYDLPLRQRKDSTETIGENYHNFLLKRSFYLFNTETEVSFKVSVKVVGEQCERVKVGTETTTKDVYEVRCK